MLPFLSLPVSFLLLTGQLTVYNYGFIVQAQAKP